MGLPRNEICDNSIVLKNFYSKASEIDTDQYNNMTVDGQDRERSRAILDLWEFENPWLQWLYKNLYDILFSKTKEALMQCKIKLYQFGIIIVASLTFASSVTHAQCKPGDILIGEDANYYYCASPASKDEIKSIAKKLDKIRREGPKHLLGEEWRFRKATFDTLGCLARKQSPYVFGAKIVFPAECANSLNWDLPVDCSGAIAYASRFAAFFVSGFYRDEFNTLRGLHTDAAGQALLFKTKKAFIPRWGNPSAGDVIFFEQTYDKDGNGVVDKRDGITHVGIYLGTSRDGKKLIIHASSRARKVVFSKISKGFEKKLAGYGNISRLYMNVK